MIYVWHDLLGNAGVVLVLAAYLLLQLEKMYATSAKYLITNAVGALLILVSLAHEFNLSAFLIETAWLLISVYGLVRGFSKGRSGATSD